MMVRVGGGAEAGYVYFLRSTRCERQKQQGFNKTWLAFFIVASLKVSNSWDPQHRMTLAVGPHILGHGTRSVSDKMTI